MRPILFVLFSMCAAATSAAEVPTERIELKELWRRGTDDDEILLGNIARILVDDEGNAYALDSQLSEVQVFSPEGEHLRTIGRAGEGPGEFNSGADLYFGLGGKVGVLQAFPGKIIQLDRDGNPLENFRLPEIDGGGFQVVLRAQASDDRLYLAGTRQGRGDGGRMQRLYLESYDADGNVITKFHEEENPFQFGGMQYTEPKFVSFQRRWVVAPDGRVMAPLSYLDYQITVWKADGTVERVIEREDYEPLERTGDEKKMLQQLFEAITSFNPRSTFELSDTHPAISQMFAREGGELWVLSSRGTHRAPEDVAFTLDVFDAQGKMVREIEMIGDIDPQEDAMFLAGDRLFVVTGSLGATMSALSAGGSEEEALGDVEPSNIVCYSLGE